MSSHSHLLKKAVPPSVPPPCHHPWVGRSARGTLLKATVERGSKALSKVKNLLRGHFYGVLVRVEPVSSTPDNPRSRTPIVYSQRWGIDLLKIAPPRRRYPVRVGDEIRSSPFYRPLRSTHRCTRKGRYDGTASVISFHEGSYLNGGVGADGRPLGPEPSAPPSR